MKYLKSIQPEVGDYVIVDFSSVFTDLDKKDTFYKVNQFLKTNIGKLITILDSDSGHDMVLDFRYIVEYDNISHEISDYFGEEEGSDKMCRRVNFKAFKEWSKDKTNIEAKLNVDLFNL